MDKELKDFLDKRFTEVDQKIDGLDKKITHADEKIANLDKKVTQANEKIATLDKKITLVDGKIDKKTEEVIHRFQVITESLEDKIKQVAEGVINLNEKFDRRIDEMNKNLNQKHQDVLAAIKFSYAELDRRITTLEVQVKQLDERVKRLESH